MKNVIAEAVETAYKFHSPVDITQVRFEWDEIFITLISGGDRKVALVSFDEIVGFRMLDEGDLLEFWPVCAGGNGWLFEISENGWFDLEMSRSGFMRDKGLGLSEYFISSQNRCISILSGKRPNVEIYEI